MENEAPRRLDPVLLRVDRSKARLDVGSGAVDPETFGDTLHMPVNGDSRYPKCRSEDDRCRLATDAVEPSEPVHVRRHLPAELVEEPAGHPAKPLRFQVEEASRFDVPLQDPGGCLCVVRGTAVLGEEDPGHLVDALVLFLRRQDRRDEEARAEMRRGALVPSPDGLPERARIFRARVRRARSGGLVARGFGRLGLARSAQVIRTRKRGTRRRRSVGGRVDPGGDLVIKSRWSP